MDLEQLLIEQNPELSDAPQPEARRSPAGEVGTGLVRGAVVQTPTLIGQGMKWFSEPGSPAYEAGESLRSNAEIRGENPDLKLQPKAHGPITNSLAAGGEMLVPSVGPQALATLGDALFPPAAPALHAAAAGATGMLFGASQAQDSYERVLDQTGDAGKARVAGMASGTIEAGGEALASAIGGKYLAGALKFLGPKKGGRVAEQVLARARKPRALVSFGKATALNAGTEVGTEMGQNAGEIAVERAAGATDGPTPGEAAVEAISPTLGMSALMLPLGGAGAYRANRRTKAMLTALENPQASVEDRTRAAAFFHGEIAQQDPEDADLWAAETLAAIAEGKPLRVVETAGADKGKSAEKVEAAADGGARPESPETNGSERFERFERELGSRIEEEGGSDGLSAVREEAGGAPQVPPVRSEDVGGPGSGVQGQGVVPVEETPVPLGTWQGPEESETEPGTGKNFSLPEQEPAATAEQAEELPEQQSPFEGQRNAFAKETKAWTVRNLEQPRKGAKSGWDFVESILEKYPEAKDRRATGPEGGKRLPDNTLLTDGEVEYLRFLERGKGLAVAEGKPASPPKAVVDLSRMDRDAAEADAVDIRNNAKAAEKLVLDGHRKNATVSANQGAHGWYLDAGYAVSEVTAALNKAAAGKPLTQKQQEIVGAWRENLERVKQEAGWQDDGSTKLSFPALVRQAKEQGVRLKAKDASGEFSVIFNGREVRRPKKLVEIRNELALRSKDPDFADLIAHVPLDDKSEALPELAAEIHALLNQGGFLAMDPDEAIASLMEEIENEASDVEVAAGPEAAVPGAEPGGAKAGDAPGAGGVEKDPGRGTRDAGRGKSEPLTEKTAAGEQVKLFPTPPAFGKKAQPEGEAVSSLDFGLEEEEAGLFESGTRDAGRGTRKAEAATPQRGESVKPSKPLSTGDKFEHQGIRFRLDDIDGQGVHAEDVETGTMESWGSIEAFERETGRKIDLGNKAEAPQDAEDFTPRDGWEANLVKAREYANALGINHRGKTLGQLVDEIRAAQGESASPSMAIADAVMESIRARKTLSWQDLFRIADEAFGGTQGQGAYTVKDAYDALELGVNRYIAEVSSLTLNPGAGLEQAQQTVEDLKALLERLPTQTKRTEEQDEFQQFSTPPTYAYVVNWLAKPQAGESVLEPSAGVGGLAVFARNAGAKVTANELSPRRAELLRSLDLAKVTIEKGELIDAILPERFDLVLMNPPFSSTAGRIKGRRQTMEGAKHVEAALRTLKPGGRLVAIVGKGMAHDAPAFRDWWDKIEGRYNVRANVGVDGSGFRKYGTTFDNQILVIDNTAPQDTIITGKVQDIAEIPALLEEVRNDRPKVDESAEDGAAKAPEQKSGSAAEAGRKPGPDDSAGVSTDAVGAARPEGDLSGSARGEVGGRDRGAAGRRDAQGTDAVPADRTGRREESPASSGRSDGRGATADRHAGSETEGRPDGDRLSVEAVEESPAADLSESVYEPYRPQRLSIPGAKNHPGNLVQSAAMASISPPAPTYAPNLPEDVIEQGKLSIAQLESVVYAGQAHGRFLTSGEREGFFIGDGTGVGKGREISGIILDNFRQGRRKAVWVSETAKLVNDAQRDAEGVGLAKSLIFPLSNHKLGTEITGDRGVLFTTYSTLASGLEVSGEEVQVKEGKQARIDQIVQWLGEDFDGVLVFDEAHNMQNSASQKGNRGVKKASARGLAGVEIQRRLPKARVVYVSATGATEVENLGYASRLGLWGEGTAFANRADFIEQIKAGGLAAMELVARDLKAMGKYIARSLDFSDVTYGRLEHPLTPAQRTAYDTLARAWQTVLQNIGTALEESGSANNAAAKSNALSKFWGAHQRFFNQVITSMQMPSLIESAKKDIESGKAVVLQLVNTNEAATNRQIARAESAEDLEDLDLTPREALMQYIERSFPVQQYEEYEDAEGNIRTRPVFDSNGNPVLNRAAVQMRENLLDQLGSIKVPDGPLEMILSEFGTKNVAEVTGRTRRIVRDESGRTKVERWSASKSAADADSFMADKKPVLVFSEAGGTGRSYHADLTKKNQRDRVHYLVQPGWRADKAVQGFGRTHRTNQKSAPHYVLVTTDLQGQRRFISSIARRLNQLGALTKGQRDTGSQGLFSEKDNLESEYARDALQRFFYDLFGSRIEGLNFGTVTEMMGFDRLVDDNGNLNSSALPEIPKFLNRVLSLEIDYQNAVFNAFAERLEQNVEAAILAGTLDVGLETYRADKVRTVSEQTVYTEQESGAQTKYVELEASHKNEFVPFDEAQQGKGFLGFYRNKKSGKLWAVRDYGTRTDKDGNVWSQYRLQGALKRSGQVLDERKFSPEPPRWGDWGWEKVADAETEWTREIEQADTYRKEPVHLVSGAILPIWDRLPADQARVMRVQTDEGHRFLGRLIPPTDIATTLKRLGATPNQVRLNPKEALQRVLEDGWTLDLANGWRIMRRMVSGEPRVELVGDDLFTHAANLEKAGVFKERINYATRFFVPSGDAQALSRVLNGRPIVEASGPVDEVAARYSVAARPLLTGDTGLGEVEVQPARALPFVRRLLENENLEQVAVKGGNVEALREIGKLFGKSFVFFRERGGSAAGAERGSAVPVSPGHGAARHAAGRGVVGGFIQPGRPDRIFLNVEAPGHVLFLTGHELSHTLRIEDPALWRQLADELRPLIRKWGEYRATLSDAHYAGLSEEEQFEELMGDVIGENFVNPAFWEEMAQADESLFRKVARKAVALLTRALRLLTGRKGVERYVTDMTQARAVVSRALVRYAKQTQAGIYRRYADQFDGDAVAERIDTEALLARLNEMGYSNEMLRRAFEGARFAAAWHGSHHDFDRFSTSAIGTGEGAQAYGYGLYFAGKKEVAEWYKRSLSGRTDGLREKYGDAWPAVRHYMDGRRERALSELDNLVQRQEEILTDKLYPVQSPKTHRGLIEKYSQIRQQMQDGTFEAPAGHLYAVELAPAEDEYLLWDKPLSEQSEKVREALQPIADLLIYGDGEKDLVGDEMTNLFSTMTGGRLYSDSDVWKKVDEAGAMSFSGDKSISEYLHSLGIRGIKYLDGASRGKQGWKIKGADGKLSTLFKDKASADTALQRAKDNGYKGVSLIEVDEGDYNYVIFDDADVSVTAKYSILPAATRKFTAKLTPDKNGLPYAILSGKVLPERLKAAVGSVLSNPHYGSRKSKSRTAAYELALERGANANEIKYEVMAQQGDYEGLEGLRDHYRSAGKEEREQIDKLLVEGDIEGREYSVEDLNGSKNPLGRQASLKVQAAYFAFRQTINRSTEVMFDRLGRLRLLPYEESAYYQELVDLLDEGLSGDQVARRFGINEKAVEAYVQIRQGREKLDAATRKYREQGWYGTLRDALLKGMSTQQVQQEFHKTPDLVKAFIAIKKDGFPAIATAEKYRNASWFKSLRDLLTVGDDHPMLQKLELYNAYRGVKEYDSQLAKLKEQWGQVNGYLPRVRKDGEQHVKVWRVEEDGTYTEVWMQPAKTKFGAEKLRDRVEENLQEFIPHSFDPQAQYHVVVEPNTATPEEIFLGIGSHRAIEGLLSKVFDKATDAGIIENSMEVQRQVLSILADEISARGFGRHRLHRAKHLIEGYETQNTPAILAQFVGGMAGWLSKSEFAMRANKLMSKIPADQPHDKTWVKEYVDDALKNSTYLDQWFGTARSFAALMYLGFKASSAVLNATQNYIWGQAKLSTYTKGATAKLLKAQHDVVKDHLLRKAGQAGILSEEEQWVLEEGLRRGRSHANYVRDLSGMDDTGGVMGKGQAGVRWLAERAMLPFQAVETYWNREPALLAAYRVFRAKGMAKEAALKEAERFVDDVHFVVGKENIPELLRKMGPFGRTLYTFQSYTHNYLLGMLTSLGKGEFEVVARSLTALVLFGGLAAVPFGDDLDKWYRRIFGERPLRVLDKWLRETAGQYTDFGDQIADFVLHGVPALGGVNFSRAIAVNLPWLSPEDESLAERVTGVWGGLTQRVRYGVSAAGRGDVLRAAEYLSPEALANILRGYRHYAEGTTTLSGRPVFGEDGKQARYTAGEGVIRVFGFMPLRPSKQSEERWDAIRGREYWQERKSDVLARIRTTKDRREIVKMVREFNLERRQSPTGILVSAIDGGTIARALRSKPDRREMAYRRD